MYHSITFDLGVLPTPPSFKENAVNDPNYKGELVQRSGYFCTNEFVDAVHNKIVYFINRFANVHTIGVQILKFDKNKKYLGTCDINGRLCPGRVFNYVPVYTQNYLECGFYYKFNVYADKYANDIGTVIKSFHINGNQYLNTFMTWSLAPSVRPHIAPPEVKTKVIDVPGRNGVLDLSETLTGKPIYKNRVGEWEFIVLNEFFDPNLSYNDWLTVYSDVMNTLHGKTGKCYLEDDPDHYYTGRFSVKRWITNKDYSRIVIGYDLAPFKQPGGGF